MSRETVGRETRTGDLTVTGTLSAGSVGNPTFTGVASFPDGSAAAPSITNTGDTNTGIFHPADDNLAISTGGTERVRVTGNGRVGIGSTNPQATLHLTSASAFLPQQYLENTNTDANPAFILFRKLPTDNSLTAGDNLGQINWQGIDTGGTARTAVNINAGVASQGASFVEGQLQVSTTNSSGSTTEKFRIDGNGLITGTGTSLGAWTAYTPTLSGTWASGNATSSGAYVQIGKTIHYRGSITIGSTTTIGAGLIIISLPVNRASGLGAQTPYGRAVFVDASLGVYNYGVCELDTSSQIIILRAEKVDGTYTELASTSSSVPFTWATNDVIRFFVTYEAA